MKRITLIFASILSALMLLPAWAQQPDDAGVADASLPEVVAPAQAEVPAETVVAAEAQLPAEVAQIAEAAAPSEVAEEAEEGEHHGGVDPKETIFEHLGDRYGWEVPFCHGKSIPLPMILFASDGLHIFSSAHIDHHQPYVDGGKIFVVPAEGPNKGKCVEVVGGEIVDGKVVGGTEVRPFDISITKNVCALIITLIIIMLMMIPLARFYRRKGMKAPRRWLGCMEFLVDFVYVGVIKSTLGDKAKKFAPFLLTIFFFIFVMNIMGLIVVFPGGANLTGNIAVTLTLAVLTFLVTNIFGTKHYWKDIFWPDVPLWLKFPIPIMPLIEVFGMFTKPAALTVRLFANMMGGHMIVIVLTLIIFIFFEKLGAVVAGGSVVISVFFSVFMLLIDVLVSFIQAYVFTMLSTIFISLAQEHPKHDHAEEAHPVAA